LPVLPKQKFVSFTATTRSRFTACSVPGKSPSAHLVKSVLK
jgi:hypothetical protein